MRHNFTFDAGYDVPSLRRFFGEGVPRWLADGFQFNTLTQIRSALPVNVTVAGGFFGGALRPNVVPGASFYLSNGDFNPAAFSTPANGTFGNLSRNALRGSNFAQVDFSVFKNTKLTETTALQLRLEFFNLFNRVNFADPFGGLAPDAFAGTLNSICAFGQRCSTVGNQLGGLLGSGGPRQIQLSARFNF